MFNLLHIADSTKNPGTTKRNIVLSAFIILSVLFVGCELYMTQMSNNMKEIAISIKCVLKDTPFISSSHSIILIFLPLPGFAQSHGPVFLFMSNF